MSDTPALLPDPESRDFQAIQLRFAAHLRDPLRAPAPGAVEDRRMRIYRELFYNNIEGFLANAFPVLRKLSPDAVWHERVRDFYARHRSTNPQFYGVAEEFLHFLEGERGEHPDDPPFLRELAHYEWVELILSVSESEAGAELADPNGNLLYGVPVMSPLAWLLAYQWPVHRIGPDFVPEQPTGRPTYLVVYRNRQDQVKFMEINAVTARLLQGVEQAPHLTGRDHLHAIAAELNAGDLQSVIDAGVEMMSGLRDRGILLGTRRTQAPASPEAS